MPQTRDGVEITPGMVIWVNNPFLGELPMRHVVGEVINDEKLKYTEKGPDGYTGCKIEQCWESEHKALEFSLNEANRIDKVELDIRPGPKTVVEPEPPTYEGPEPERKVFREKEED